MNHVGNPDADEVEAEKRSREYAHGERVWCGRDDGRNDEDDENREADVLPQETRADDAEQRQKEDEDRHFKRDAQAKNHRQKEVRVFVDLDERAELLAESEEEVERAGK